MLSAAVSFGQIVVESSTTLSESVDLGETALWVGYTNSSVELAVDDLTLTAGEVVLGNYSVSTNNTLSFDGGVGTFSGSLLVGNTSSGNVMTVENDSAVTSYHGIIGYDEDSDGNAVEVSDDSSWDVTSILTVGEGGAENSLSITDGSEVTADSLNIGVQDSADGNSVLVSDSTLEVTDGLTLGKFGSDNQLIITNGATVTSGDAWVGSMDDDYDDGEDDNDDNTVIVTGADSGWTIDGGLEIGTTNNEGNIVSVINGGSISADSLTLLGADNGFELNDGGSLTVNSDFNASMTGFDFNAGGSLYVGGELTGMTNEVEEGRTLGITGDGNWDQSGAVVTVGGSSSNNALVVDGGTVTADSLQVGSVGNSSNTVVVSSSGKISVAGVSISGTDSTLTVKNGGRLSVDSDFDAGMTGFVFGSGAELETGGVLTGMGNTLEDSRKIFLTGGTWDVGSELTVGESTSDNAVYVTSGGKLTSSGAVIGATTNGTGNNVYVQDAESVWTVGGALEVGDAGSGNSLYIQDGGVVTSTSTVIGGTGTNNMIWVQGMDSLLDIGTLEVNGSGNVLTIADGGSVTASGSFTLQNNATLTFSSNGTVSASSYYQDALSTVEFNTMTNIAEDTGTALIVATGSAELEDGASFYYTGSIGGVDIGVTNSRKIITSSSLNVDLDELNGTATEGLMTSGFFAQNDNLYYQIFREKIAEAAGFASGSMMSGVSDEIDQLASVGNADAENQWDLLNQMEGAQMNAQLTQLYEQSAPTYMHMAGLFDGMRQVQNRGVMPDAYWPVGALGPHLYGDQVQGWVKGYGSWATQDGSAAFSGYDQSVYGVMVGFDKAYGDYLFGGAGGYASSDISQDDGDSSKSGTGFGMLYSSWGSQSWFADASVAYGLGSVKNDSGTVFDTSAEFDSSQFAYYLGGGKEMVFKDDRLFVTPSAGLMGGLYMQDSYTESSSTAVAKNVDAYSHWSLDSEIGAKVAFHKELNRSVLMPEVHANWIHQFNTDEEHIDYSLVGGTGQYSFGMQAPVSDLVELGVGLSLWKQSRGGSVFEWGLGFDSRFGDGYSASAVNARLVVEF
jgi:outer membrane autotransporter protein